MNFYVSTPLDDLDIPDTMTYQASHRTFATPHSRHVRNFQTRTEVTAYVSWCLNSGNVRDITVHLYRGADTWPAATLTVIRPHNLAPWTCAQVPEWQAGIGDLVAAAAINAAVEIISAHQRMR